MTLSKSEIRHKLIGHKAKCEVCLKKSLYSERWRVSRIHDKICLNCVKDYPGVMVNI